MSSFKDTMYCTVANKCPSCHKGQVFENNNPYSFKNGLTMNKTCPMCGVKYEKETGFFYGAMYVSYALQVALFVTVYTLNYWFFNLDAAVLVAVIVGLIVGLFPVTFRWSRIMWISMFTHGKKRANNMPESSVL